MEPEKRNLIEKKKWQLQKYKMLGFHVSFGECNKCILYELWYILGRIPLTNSSIRGEKNLRMNKNSHRFPPTRHGLSPVHPPRSWNIPVVVEKRPIMTLGHTEHRCGGKGV